jgi:leucyl/phenylalanyl-tRNA--protein transferase
MAPSRPPTGDFDLEDLIECYRRGVFPMSDARDDDRIFLVDPQRRGVLPLRGFHVPHRLARTVRSDPYQVRVNTAFDAVVEACALARPGRTETWINRPIQEMYGALYRRGQAHSIECWQEGELVGGLYGVALAGAFFGESMFSTARDASKVALIHLVARLIIGRFELLDAQFMTGHLMQFGARDISRVQYRAKLASALAIPDADFYRMPAYAAGAASLQAISQAS